MMPKKDGFTLAQEVRAANAEIPNYLLDGKDVEGRYFGRFQDWCR